MENKTNLEILFKKYADGSASKEEVEELLNCFQEDQNKNEINLLIDQFLSNNSFATTTKSIEERRRILESKEFLLSEIRTQKPKVTSIGTTKWRVVIAAASVMLIASLIFIYHRNQDSTTDNKLAIADIQPGSNKAILTLSDGRKISLTDAKNGALVEQAGAKISKTDEGTIVYNASAKSGTAYNSIETPKGGEYKVVLPDGSKVWLNAASSIKYPLSFSAFKERRIELIGEAYFEVVHNKAMPFRVVANGQTVEVLGTHFNINSYADEKKTTTTLEEGSVKVYSNNQAKIIKPGEQTVLGKDGDINVQDADMQTALAWKNGKIRFKDADIKTIMRQVSRWYNLEVEYQGEITQRSFNGGVSRTSNLSSLLKILELNNIHFEIETNGSNKKLIVKP